MHFFEPVLDRIKLKFPRYDHERIRLAYEFARDAHEGQKRFSGEPYIVHPVAVVDLLLDLSPDEEMIIAALLHDVSEDTDRTLEDIAKNFGPRVAYLVKGLEKLSKVRARVDEPEIENLRKMFVHMASDLRIIIIKLCDRLHNMSTLEYVKPHKQERIARETLNVYVPIASRLGIYKIKGLLEDYCFEFLMPEEFRNIREQLSSYNKMTSPVIEEIKKTLQKQLAMEGYASAKVEVRLKSIFSIFTKLKRKGRSSVDDIYDVFAMRVILEDDFRNGKEYTGHVYTVLGIIHGMWTPLQTRFKDYIAVPKPNGYRSLHTTVIGLGPKTRNQPTEIQIRTQAMHAEAESGVASHWLYDETGGASAEMGIDAHMMNPRLLRQVDWVKSLTNLQEEVGNNQEFIADLQRDIFSKRIFVLTPGGDVKDLPNGATPIDFAYAVHSEVGNHAVMAKVNGSIVPLDFDLKNGNVVEIITRENSDPSQYWLSFVKTSSARSKIKNWFKSHDDPQKSLREGREILNRHLEELSKDPLGKDLLILKTYKSGKLTLKDREELLRELGRGNILAGTIIKNLYPQDELLRSKSRAIAIKNRRLKRKAVVPKDLTKEVVVDGHDDLPVKIAACCKPTQRDIITGYITRGSGITVHKEHCKVIKNVKEERFLDVNWAGSDIKPRYRVTLEVIMEDRIGLLSDISNLTTKMGINITGMELQRDPDSPVLFREFEVEVDDYDQLARLIRKMREVPNVKTVRKLD